MAASIRHTASPMPPYPPVTRAALPRRSKYVPGAFKIIESNTFFRAGLLPCCLTGLRKSVLFERSPTDVRAAARTRTLFQQQHHRSGGADRLDLRRCTDRNRVPEAGRLFAQLGIFSGMSILSFGLGWGQGACGAGGLW